MPVVLVFGDTIRSPEMRHEVPVAIPDPFLYVEQDGTRAVVISSLELQRVREAGLDVIPWEELGFDELVEQGVAREELYLHFCERACRRIGIDAAVVPAGFPLELADHLREAGIDLQVDRKLFSQRRRVKTSAELDGIRRAQRAAEAGMDAVRELLRTAKRGGRGLTLEGQPLTCERLKHAIGEVFTEHDVAADELIVSHGPQSAIGHDMGSGPIAEGEPIVVDLWPKDRQTACHADMTRTFVVGEPPDELVEYHRLCLEALEQAIAAIRPSVPGRDVYKLTCDLFHAHGHRTLMSKEPGEVLEEGFFHGLGHGLGLEVHEEPGMGIASRDELIAGDVVTVEPGLYRPGFGGCRLEDVVLVTEDGAENLTDYPYDLEP